MTARGWCEAALSEIATLYQGAGFPKELQGRDTGDLGFYKVSDISRTVLAGRDTLGPAAHCISRQEAAKLRATPIPANAVVFARIGEAIGLNRRALLPTEALVDNNVVGVKARHGVIDRYLLHFLRTIKLRELSQATTVPAVRSSDLAAIRVPLPPSAEQERIVSRMEEVFSEIDEGERALERAHKLVERYRQSVITAAVTGELTREWRERNSPAPASVAVKQFADARAHKGRNSAPTPLADVDDLPALPSSWAWTSLDSLAEVVGGITVDRKRSSEGCDEVPYLRVANVQRGHLDLAEVKTIVAPRERIEQLRLVAGDILFNEGGDIDKLGRGWLWQGELPLCIHQNHVFRARLYSPGPWNKLISWFGNVLGKRLFMEMGKQTTNLASLSLSKLKSLPVPLMSLEEAAEIVSRCEDALSVVDKCLTELATQQRGSAGLRQAVLKAAFSGQLVPQDPADEPASTLLARLAEQAADSPASPRRRVGKVPA